VHVNEANRGPSDAGGVHIGMSMTSDVLVAAGYVAHQVGKVSAPPSPPALFDCVAVTLPHILLSLPLRVRVKIMGSIIIRTD
jgi:hypothetical protein